MVEGDYVGAAGTFRFLRVGILRGSYLTQAEFLHPRDHWESMSIFASVSRVAQDHHAASSRRSCRECASRGNRYRR